MINRDELIARMLDGPIEEADIPAIREEMARDPEFAAELTDLTPGLRYLDGVSGSGAGFQPVTPGRVSLLTVSRLDPQVARVMERP